MQPEVRLSKSETSITAYIQHELCVSSTASADLIGNEWWISRVFVHAKYRRQHIGTLLVKTLQTHASNLVVTPGGYDMEPVHQYGFYRSLGFVPDSILPEGLRWTATK
jgi:GNAT superfamily N-acetyltransferase